MKNIIFILGLFMPILGVSQKHFKCVNIYYDYKTQTKIFIIDKYDYSNFYFYSPDDTVKIFKTHFLLPTHLIAHDTNYFIFFQDKGTDYLRYYIFRTTDNKLFPIDLPLALDTKNHLIAYTTWNTNKVFCTNFLTDETKTFFLKNQEVGNLTYYIDTAFFWNNAFYIQWDEIPVDDTELYKYYKSGQYSKIFSIQ